MQEENQWKIRSSSIVYQNPWVKVREDKVTTPTGKDSVYAFMESDDSVIVVALNDKQEIYVVHTFRYPEHTWNWELPGGGGANQDPQDAARRELEEETGIIAKTWTKLGKTTVCNGLLTEKMHTYLAQDLSFSGTKEQEDEQMSDAKFVSLSEAQKMIDTGDINDGQTITALFFVMRWLETTKQ